MSPRPATPRATIFATGSEVEIAIAAQALLRRAQRRRPRRLGAVLELFLPQPDDDAPEIIGDAPVKVAIEAAVRFGWDASSAPTASSSA